MATDASRALDEMLNTLSTLGASDLAEEIRRVVARGTIVEAEAGSRKNEVVRKPLPPDEAYYLAVGMLCAAIDPVLIWEDIHNDLSPPQTPTQLVWKQDFIEGSPVEPSADAVDFPQLSVDDMRALREATARVINILEEITSKG